MLKISMIYHFDGTLRSISKQFSPRCESRAIFTFCCRVINASLMHLIFTLILSLLRSSMKNSNNENCRYEDLLPSSRNLESSLEQALKEASEDATLKKIKRISYSANAVSEVINFFSLCANCFFACYGTTQ
jgi:hypothetical protein